MAIYRDIYDGPPRWYGDQHTTKRYVAIHSTENTASAEDEADFAKRRPDSTSSHYYVDGNSIVQSLDTDLRAFHAGSSEGNSRAIAYELTGRASWSRSQWLAAVDWGKLVGQIRRDCAEHHIIARDLSVSQIVAGDLTGIITHNEMRLAWGGTTHTDPGAGFPMDHLIGLLQGDDMATAKEVWDHLIPPGEDIDEYSDAERWRALSILRSSQTWAYRATKEARKSRAESAAILAAVAGQDVVAAVAAELDKAAAAERTERAAERTLLVTTLTTALPDLLADKLGQVPPEQVKTAVLEGLATLRLVAEPAP